MNDVIRKFKSAYDRADKLFKRGFNRLFFSCEKMSRLSSEKLDRPLSAPEIARSRIHLSLCTWCRTYEKQLKFLKTQLSAYSDAAPPLPPEEALSTEARKRILAQISSGKKSLPGDPPE